MGDDGRNQVIGQIRRYGVVQAVIVGNPRKIRRAYALEGFPVVSAIPAPEPSPEIAAPTLEQIQEIGDTDDLVFCQQYIIALEAEVERLRGELVLRAVRRVAERIEQQDSEVSHG